MKKIILICMFIMFIGISKNLMGTGGDYTMPIIETPSYSPDGKKIVFASDVAYRYVDIWIINSDGTGLKRLTKDIGDERNPTWSPDGSKIAYKAGNVWIMNPDGTGKKEVKNRNCTTQWFPGTNKLLCFENKIYLYDPITDEKQPTEFKIPLFAKITPSGDKYVYVECTKENENLMERCYNLFIANIDGTGRRQITFGEHDDGDLSWHPSGNKIIFHSDRENTNGIWEVNIDGTGLRCITPYGYYPSYSPDGKKIVFTRLNSLWVINSDGTGEKKLVEFKKYVLPIVPVRFYPDKWNIEWLDKKHGEGFINCYIGKVKGDPSIGIEGYEVEEIEKDSIEMTLEYCVRKEYTLLPEGPYKILNHHPGFEGKVLKIKFNKFKAIETLTNNLEGRIEVGKSYKMLIRGKMKDGREFWGKGVIKVIGEKKDNNS